MTTARALEAAVPGPGAIDAARDRDIGFVSIVLPCLNEEEAVGPTVREALDGLRRAGVEGEVLVVDNGSTDRSVELAGAAGARVVHEPERGYGAAHLAGIRAARGAVVVMADADQTYDLENVGKLLEPLRRGADLVVASRLDEIAPGAMPFLHRRVGTPLITRALRVLTGAPLSDSQSGYRAFWRDRIDELDLRTPGMEYASEMLLKAVRAELDVREVAAPYRVRVGESKLNTFSDGWRHLRMLLILSPHLTLLLPGLATLAAGLALSSISLFAPGGLEIGGAPWLPVFLGPILLILEAQVALLGALAAARSDLTPAFVSRRLGVFRRRDAVDALLWRFVLLALGSAALDAMLFAAWAAEVSGPSLLGLAGIAQAAIVVGIGGFASVLAADFSRDSLWGAATASPEPEADTPSATRPRQAA